MKRIIILFLFFICYGVKAQNESINITLDHFKDVKVFDGLSVTLIKSNENKAIITGANTNKVALVNTGGVLKIRMEITKIFSGYRTFIELHHTDALVVLDVNEDSQIASKQPIIQEILELKAQEGGVINIDAQVEQLLIKTVTGGIITAKGKGNIQDIIINTGGIYYGKEFTTKFTTVNVNAGSTAEIYATDYVKASVKAGGTVKVYGNTTKIEEKTVFGGKIIRM